MAVSLQDTTNTQPLAQVEQLLVFVGSVDQHRVARLATAQHEHVVRVWPDDDTMDLETAVSPVKRDHGADDS
jgi:hypothetical protein